MSKNDLPSVDVIINETLKIQKDILKQSGYARIAQDDTQKIKNKSSQAFNYAVKLLIAAGILTSMMSFDLNQNDSLPEKEDTSPNQKQNFNRLVYNVIAEKALNIRREPKMGNNIIDTVTQGSCLIASDDQPHIARSWMSIEYNFGEGFSRKGYVYMNPNAKTVRADYDQSPCLSVRYGKR